MLNVLISGGGVAGLTLANRLLHHGHRPVIVEKAPRLRDDGYMIDFFGPGYEVAEKMGLLPDLARVHVPIPELVFLDARGEEKFSVAYAALRRLLDDRHFNFMRGDLERLLYATIENRVEVRFGATVAGFEQDEARVHARFADGATEAFDLLVGADGVHSAIRALAFGAEAHFTRPLGYHTAAFIIDRPRLQRALGAAFATMTTPGRQIGLYPTRDGRMAAFFIHTAERAIDDLSLPAIRRELHAAYAGLGAPVPEMLAYADAASDIYFDAVTQIAMPCWSRGRVTLVGDACQCVSLIAGQGASLAMTGAYLLAEELSAAGADVGAALTRYERTLKPDIERRQAAGRRLARWFVPDSRLRLFIRDAAMRLTMAPLVAGLIRRRFAFAGTLK